MNEGENVNIEIDTAVISRKSQIGTKKILTTNQNITKWCTIGILSIVAIAVIYTIIYNIAKPTPDYNSFKTVMRSYLEKNDDISDIVIEDNNMFRVIVKDSWFNTSEIVKLRFCKNVHDTIFVYADKYNLIYGDNKDVYVYFYDTSGVKLADQSLGSFDILH